MKGLPMFRIPKTLDLNVLTPHFPAKYGQSWEV